MLWQQSNDAASAEQHNKGLGMAVPKRTRKINFSVGCTKPLKTAAKTNSGEECSSERFLLLHFWRSRAGRWRLAVTQMLVPFDASSVSFRLSISFAPQSRAANSRDGSRDTENFNPNELSRFGAELKYKLICFWAARSKAVREELLTDEFGEKSQQLNGMPWIY